MQPPLGRAFFSFQYSIDFLYDFIRLILLLHSYSFSLSPSLSVWLSHTHTHAHTDARMPAFPPSNQSRQLVFGSMGSMSRLQRWKWKIDHSEEPNI